MLSQAALKRKQAVMLGDGEAEWSRVHIRDLSSLYFLLLQKVVDPSSGHDVPFGKQGYYFASHGKQSWKSIAERISEVGKGIGGFENEKVGSMGLGEAKEEFEYGSERDAEGVLGSRYVSISSFFFPPWKRD
jgi:nucleoside-diphosphate-sugar epimerase